MASFNRQRQRKHSITINKELEVAYPLPPELDFFCNLVTSFREEGFYSSAREGDYHLHSLIKSRNISLEFMRNAIWAARHIYHMRTKPLVALIFLAVEEMLDAALVEKTIARADEMAELLAIYSTIAPIKRSSEIRRFKRKKLQKLSVPLRKGIARAFWKFDEYQLAKYKGKTKQVSLRDVVFITHPLAMIKDKKPDQIELIGKIINNTLEIPSTWETRVSTAGSDIDVNSFINVLSP
jgi:hypothetical protein